MAEIAVRDDINNTKNIISKRLMNLDYYKRLHQGSLFWLNAIRLSHDHIRRHYDEETLALRAKQFFCLGMSIGNILRINDLSQALYATLLLFSEYEFHFHTAGPAQAIKLLYARDGTYFPQSLSAYNANEPANIQLSKFGKKVVLEFLKTPNNTENLDYFQVFYSLCESLTQLYEKFNNLDVEHKHHYEEFLAFDNKIKHHIISKISNDMNDLAQSVLHDQLETMENLFDDPGQGLCVMYEENW
jgi:hypothetical protein